MEDNNNNNNNNRISIPPSVVTSEAGLAGLNPFIPANSPLRIMWITDPYV